MAEILKRDFQIVFLNLFYHILVKISLKLFLRVELTKRQDGEYLMEDGREMRLIQNR